MKRKILALVNALVLVAVLLPATVYGTTDVATGTFTIGNNTPSNTAVTLYDSDGTTPATSMTPQTEYVVKVAVDDVDGLANLKTIVVKIYFDNATEGTDLTEFNGKSADTKNCAIITWTQATVPNEPTDFVLTTMAGTTWAKGTCVEPGDLASPFQFKFTVGKVATEADGGPANDWQIAAQVTDDSNQTDWAAISSGVPMNWYGEVSFAATGINWGSVSANMAFAEGDPSEESVGNITYICNGAYEEKVMSAASWSGSTHTATLDEDGSSMAANSFSLKADDDDTLTDAVLVTASGATIDDTGLQTTETGDVVANSLWLQLASTFAGDSYSGAITYTIANGS